MQAVSLSLVEGYRPISLRRAAMKVPSAHAYLYTCSVPFAKSRQMRMASVTLFNQILMVNFEG
jgi:hypothetical protein